MLGSMNSKGVGHSGPTRPLKGKVYRYGKQAECELCGSVRQCVDRYGLVTCQTCQSEYLPSTGGVLYRG